MNHDTIFDQAIRNRKSHHAITEDANADAYEDGDILQHPTRV
jgi:hypothetical protein